MDTEDNDGRSRLPDIFSLLAAGHDRAAGAYAGGQRSERRLSQLGGIWVDKEAYTKALDDGDRLVYSVETMEPAQGEGALHYGIGRIEPGRIGDEYFMTRGHLHEWRPAAEVYIGLTGHGMMQLENEVTGESRLLRLDGGDFVYVPGFTAHRTINVGDDPLMYIGVYPAMAGHDYRSIAERNFRTLVIDIDGVPTLRDRRES